MKIIMSYFIFFISIISYGQSNCNFIELYSGDDLNQTLNKDSECKVLDTLIIRSYYKSNLSNTYKGSISLLVIESSVKNLEDFLTEIIPKSNVCYYTGRKNNVTVSNVSLDSLTLQLSSRVFKSKIQFKKNNKIVFLCLSGVKVNRRLFRQLSKIKGIEVLELREGSDRIDKLKNKFIPDVKLYIR